MAKEEKGRNYIKNYTLEPMISPYSNYPESLLKALHMKWVIGPEGAIPEKDAEVSAMQIDPGTYYGTHVHPQPEIFIIASGKAEFEWGDETFLGEAGTVAYCPPNMPHAIRVTGSEPLRAFAVRWAPEGRREIRDALTVMLNEPT